MGIIDSLSAPDENGIVWRKLKSSSGKDFEVGNRLSDLVAAVEALKSGTKAESNGAVPPKVADDSEQDLSSTTTANGTDAPATKATTATTTNEYSDDASIRILADNWTGVYWPVGDGKWKITSPAVQGIGISRYRLYYNGNPNLYDYTLDFTNTKGWGFNFKDEGNEVYSVSTILNGDHWLKYNSDHPTIIGVRQD